ncbi:MAG: hypothetical protein ACAH95_09380 [Fimbriimonas sp.]
MKSALLAILGLAWVAQGQSTFTDPAKSITLRYSGLKSFEYKPDDVIRFSGTGSPVVVDAVSSGLVLNGNELSLLAKSSAKLFYLQEATLNGSSVVISDTKVREDFEVSRKLRTELSPEQSRTRVDSATIHYKGTRTEGELTVPSKLRIRSDTAGARTIKKEDKDVAQTYTQNLDLTGTSGVMSLDPNAKTTATNLKKGTIEGVVEFNFNRVEKDADTAEPVVSTLVGRGDQLVFDFTGTVRTIKLVGNVHMVGTGSYTADINCHTFIITVDEKLQPIRYEAEGGPPGVGR